jgi:peptide-methionine (S)-S-oxide reductase
MMQKLLSTRNGIPLTHKLLRRAFFGPPPTKTAGPAHLKVLENAKRRQEELKGIVNGNSTATLAAGCFWGVELAFQRVPGITRTAVGYTAGHDPAPTYQKICTGSTGHVEAVEIDFDPNIVSFKELLTIFWDIHDGTQLNKQGNDHGTQYRSGIYWHSIEQRDQALQMHDTVSKHLMETIGLPLVTEIEKVENFFNAEVEHQQYLEKGGQNSTKMCSDPIRCYG